MVSIWQRTVILCTRIMINRVVQHFMLINTNSINYNRITRPIWQDQSMSHIITVPTVTMTPPFPLTAMEVLTIAAMAKAPIMANHILTRRTIPVPFTNPARIFPINACWPRVFLYHWPVQRCWESLRLWSAIHCCSNWALCPMWHPPWQENGNDAVYEQPIDRLQ